MNRSRSNFWFRVVLVTFAASRPSRSIASEASAHPDPNARTTVDITKPLADLPPASTASDPIDVSRAIQSRLDWLDDNRLGGRIYIPAGHWSISRPIFMNGDNKEIVGAGAGLTIIEAAVGYRAMPMINVGARTELERRPLQRCNRVLLTDMAARVLDESVTGDRYGLRTYAEYPPAHFPAVSHLATIAKDAKAWAISARYAVNDIAALSAPASPRPLEAVCVREHVASEQNEPFKGPDWKRYWVVKIPAHVQFVGDPFSAGAFDSLTRRATDWSGMDRFTLDFIFTQNADAKIYAERRMLCGVVMGETSRPSGKVWMLDEQENGDLLLDVSLADGSTRSIKLGPGCSAPGTYRLAMQLDLGAHRVDAWLRRPGEPMFTRTCNDDHTLPLAGRFRQMEYGFFNVTGADSGSPAGANGHQNPPTDITVCGLHMSAALRYQNSDSLLGVMGNRCDDNFRCFTNDAGTMAFLPLTDNPEDAELKTAGLLVTVQHGDASGDATQKGFGYFKVPAQIQGIARPRVSDLTLRPGPTWGVGILTWHTLDCLLSNLDIRGGFYAVGDLFYGAQYTFDVHDCLMSGSEAAFNGSSNIVFMKNVTIDPVGRCGILVGGSNLTLDTVSFRHPEINKSEYYFRHLANVDYGGMNLATNVHGDAPAGSGFPTKAAFSQMTIWGSRTSIVMRDCSAANMAAGAAFLELPLVPRAM